MTLVAAINAAGRCIQPYCIFKEHPDKSWADSGLDVAQCGYLDPNTQLDFEVRFGVSKVQTPA